MHDALASSSPSQATPLAAVALVSANIAWSQTAGNVTIAVIAVPRPLSMAVVGSLLPGLADLVAATSRTRKEGTP